MSVAPKSQTGTSGNIRGALRLIHWSALLVLVLSFTLAAEPSLARARQPRNFDARIIDKALLPAQPRVAQTSALAALQARVSELGVELDERTGVTRTLSSHTGYLTAHPRPAALGATPYELALDFLQTHTAALGLSERDLHDLEITDTVHTRATGATRLYLRQTLRGIPVYNGQIQINVGREGRLLSVHNAFLADLEAAVGTTEPRLGAAEAIAHAGRHLGLGSFEALSHEVIRGPGAALRFVSSLSREPIQPRLMILPIRASVARLVWNFQLHTPDGAHIYDFTVDADDGKVWTRFDWVHEARYRVYSRPMESPQHTSELPPNDGRGLEIDPHDAAASPLGWHETSAARFTKLRGNNVHAYSDLSNRNGPPASEPNCGQSLSCDFPLDLENPPESSTAASVANLFYWTNLVHDIQYQYGFDEEAGNFQFDNFGRGGQGGDLLLAEALDGGGNCNANFATPPEGSRPRMQMYTCNNSVPAADGSLDNGVIVHEYGHGITMRQIGGPANSSCLGNLQQPGEGWSDWLALVYTAEASHRGVDRRGIGTYLFGQPPDGDGIRPQPYSTDPELNDMTYESIRGLSVPHGVGTVWGQALWEVYWALVDRHGFDPDLAAPTWDRQYTTGGAGNQRALLYVNEGLKNTACSPTFTDARDGVIQAAIDHFGSEDVCLIWNAFAAFGLGTDAVSGGMNSTHPTNGFQAPEACLCSPQPAADAGPDRTLCRDGAATLGASGQSDTAYRWTPGDMTSPRITVAPLVTTSYSVSAETACGAAHDEATVFVVGDGDGGLEEDFEAAGLAGPDGWTATGQWHATAASDCARPENGFASPVTSFYFGDDSTCTYAGGSKRGTLTSPPIFGLTATSTLRFRYLRGVESFDSGSYDRTEVEILADGESTPVFALDSTTASEAIWKSSGLIDLGAFAGRVIRIRFTFDSLDNVKNDYIGWFIDDIVVTGEPPCGISGRPPGDLDFLAQPSRNHPRDAATR